MREPGFPAPCRGDVGRGHRRATAGPRSLATAGPNTALTESRWTVRRATDARAYELAEGLWCLRLPLRFVAPRSVNAYLFPLADGYCLVDCGTSLEPGWSALEYALDLAGVAPHQLSLLICTHLHADHAGLAAEVVARTGCEFARGAGPATPDHRLRNPHVPLAERRRIALREGLPDTELNEWVEPEPEDDLGYPRLVPDRVLASGDEIDSLWARGPWCLRPVIRPLRSSSTIAAAGG